VIWRIPRRERVRKIGHDEQRLAQRRLTILDTAGNLSESGCSIGDDDELFAIGAKVRAGIDISEYAGRSLPFEILIDARKLYAFVPLPDSEAQKHGHDLVFVVCSRPCGKELTARLKEEKKLGDMIENLDGF
jgi:hypothetical protein